MYALWNKITIKLILCYNLYASCYSIYSKLSCNLIKMRLWGKCPLVNLLHIFGTPIRKSTTGGLLVGGMISMSRSEEGGWQNCPSTLTFVWQQLEAWNFAQGIFNTIGFEWCKYIPCDDHGLKRRDNHGLKTGLHFFSSQKVNKQNKHLHVWW